MTRPRRTPNRRGEGARLRAELIDAASVLLEELPGEDALSLRAVTRRAGVAPQSIYLHFHDKRELLRAIYEARFAQLLAAMRDAAAGAAAPQDQLRALCRAYCDFGDAHPGHYRVLFGTAGTPGWEPDRLPGLEAFALLRAALAAANGDSAGAVPLHARTAALWAGLHGLVTLRRDRPSFPWPPIDDLIAALAAASPPDAT